MAGGKETPRQKMIGMMYLVLTALLALNVSKSILEAFVAFDNNIKDGTETIAGQGRAAFLGIEEMAKSGEGGRKAAALKIKPQADAIKELTDNKIVMLNEMRDKMLKLTGEDLSLIKIEENGEIDYNLEAVSAKDNYDVPMQVMVGADIKRPDEKKDGMKLWKGIQDYRDGLTKAIANHGNFSFDPTTYDPENPEASLANVDPDDKGIIMQIYSGLTKVERADTHNGEIKNIHWVGRTFDHAPIVAAMATLSSLEQEFRTAESRALGHLRAKIGSSEYSFNKIQQLAFSNSNYYNSGDSMEVEVMMAAYDSYNAPVVQYRTKEGEPLSAPVEVREGKAFIKLKANGSGPQELSGDITIQKKNGTKVTKKWSFPYTIGQPTGAVSLPEMNMLYRGYNNKVTGAASGFPGYKLSMSNGSISKTGEFWIAKPGSGRESSITISGVASDGKTASLGTFKYRVSALPPPDVQLGNIKSGDAISKGQIAGATKFFAKYGPEIPLDVNFSVVSWELRVSGAPRPIKGTGSSFSGAGRSLLKQAPKGGIVTINTRVKGPDGGTRKRNMSFTIR